MASLEDFKGNLCCFVMAWIKRKDRTVFVLYFKFVLQTWHLNSAKKAFDHLKWTYIVVGHFSGFLAQGGGNLNTNLPKTKMRGGGC